MSAGEYQEVKGNECCIETQQAISINGEELENVSTFIYLGSEVNCEKSSTADINYCIGKAWLALTKMRAIWASNQYSRGTKLWLNKSNVLSVWCMVLNAGKFTSGMVTGLMLSITDAWEEFWRMIFWSKLVTRKRSRDTPKEMWHSTVEKERIELGWRSWAYIQLHCTAAKSRREWRSFTCTLCTTGRGKDDDDDDCFILAYWPLVTLER